MAKPSPRKIETPTKLIKKDTQKIEKKRTKTVAAPTTKPKKVAAGENSFGQVINRLGHGIFLTVLTMAAIGAAVAAGAYITYELQRDIWETRFQNENKMALVDKRIELLELTTRLMSKSLALKNMKKASAKKSLSALARLGLDPSKIVDVISENLDRKALAKCNFLESHAEYATIMQQNRIFFGDSTRTILRRLERIDPWWSITKKQRTSLIFAMEFDFLRGYATDTYLNRSDKR